MKPRILEIGKVYELPDGRTMIEGWHFDNRHNNPKPLTAEDMRSLLLGRYEWTDADPEDMWSVDELRAICEQEAVLSLLPTVGE